MSQRASFSLAIALAGPFLVSPYFAGAAYAQAASASVFVAVAQPQPVAAGANFDYVINVNNEGPADAANPSLTFPLPAGTVFRSESVPGGWSCNSIAPGALSPTVTCTAATLAPGTATFTITASTPPTASGTFSTAATVSSTTPDPNLNDNFFSIDVIVTPQSDFSMLLTAAPNPVNAGANVTWTMTVTNGGPSNASDATANLPLPAQTTFVSVSAPAGWSCTTPAAGANGTVSCSLTTSMNPATAATFTIVSRVLSSTPSGTSIAATATVSSTTDTAPANDSAAASVRSAVLFDLSIAKTRAPSSVFPGLPLQYTIVVTDNGPSDASNITMTDVLPAPLRFASLSAPGGWSCVTPAVGANGTVSCSILSMSASGGAATFTLNVTIAPTATAGTSINNTATVASSPTDSNNANNSATASAVVATPPDVVATKSIGGGAQHAEGSLVTYTIVLSNSGSIAQGDNPGNELTDVLPSSLTLISALATSGTAVANIPTNTVTWNGAIAGGGNVTIAIQAVVKNGTNGSTIANSATVSFDSDANGTNDTTRTSDDPSTIAPFDATAFQVVGIVPALSALMLILLAAALTAMALTVMRK